jgi:hypothetical protein
MNSALKLKMKPTAQRYASGGVASLMKKAATERKKPVPKYADTGSVSTQYVSNVPQGGEEAYANLVKDAGILTDPSKQPYKPYVDAQGNPQQRTAQFTDLQNQSYGGIADLGVSGYTDQAGGLASTAAARALNSSYNPSSFSTYGSGPQQVSAGAGPQQVSGPGGPQQVSAYGSGPQQVQGPGAIANVSGPGAAKQVGTQSFLQNGTAGAYMNPYMQNVVDTQKREAVRSDDVARTGRNAQAVGAGAFGGSRQAIQEAEANRNLQTRLGDIQTTGSNAAYQQAQQQFNTEQGQSLAAQQANQQAGLSTSQMGQQAALANQQTAYGLAGLNQQAQQANQNAALGYGSQFLQAGQANQQAGTQYAQMGQQAALANQNAGLQFGQQNLSAQQANQTAGLNFGNQYLDAQKLGEASKQFGATYGNQALQTGLQGATALSGLGNDAFKQQYTALTGQNEMGTQQQQNAQAGLDQKYADFQTEMNYPYQQLGFMSDILRGSQGSSRSMYEQPAQSSSMQNLLGLGSIIYGASGKAAGGVIEGGLAAIAPDSAGDFADGGIVGYAAGSDDNGIIGGGVDRYGVPYDPEEDMYEGAPSHNPFAAAVTTKKVWDAAKGAWVQIGERAADRAAVQRHLSMSDPSTAPEAQKAYAVEREAKRAAEAAAGKVPADSARVLRTVSAEAPATTGAAVKAATKAGLGTAAKVASKVVKPLAPLMAGYETYNMTPEERERQLWMDPDPNRSGFKKGATAVGSFGYNLVNDLAFGLPDYLRDRKPAPHAPAAEAPAAAPTGIEQLDPAAKAEADRYSLAALLSSSQASTPGPMSLAQMQKLQQGTGYNPQKYKGVLTDANTEATKADVGAAEAGLAALEKHNTDMGDPYEKREKMLNAQLDDSLARGKKVDSQFWVDLGLNILASPGGRLPQIVAKAAQAGLVKKDINMKELRSEQKGLQESMSKLSEARWELKDTRGKDRIAAEKAVKQAEVDGKKRAGKIAEIIGAEELMRNPSMLFEAVLKEDSAYKQRAATVSVANAGMRGRLGIEQIRLDRLGGAGGGKPMTPAQRDTAIRNEIKLLQAQPGGSRLAPEVLEQKARQIVESRQHRTTASSPYQIVDTQDDDTN